MVRPERPVLDDTGLPDQTNRNFRRICFALNVNRDEIREILRLGGVAASGERITRWSRNRTGPGGYQTMSEVEFNAFCEGLVPWTKRLVNEGR